MSTVKYFNGTAWERVTSTGPAGADGAPGADGANGADGATGPAGPGLAVGGTTGQVATKASATDFDVTWTTLPTDHVTSTTITAIVKLTQAAYDAIGTKSATTLYLVVG